MNAVEGSLPAAYFDAIYAANSDLGTSRAGAYEAEKYRTTLAALGQRQFVAGLEIGCSIGVLTARLAARCERLLAVDVSEAALAQARVRCAGLPGVSFRRMSVPAEFPTQRFDLVLTSEVAYYWSVPICSGRQSGSKRRCGRAAHGCWCTGRRRWPTIRRAATPFTTPSSPAAPEGGALRHVSAQRHASYRLDLFERRSAAADGR